MDVGRAGVEAPWRGGRGNLFADLAREHVAVFEVIETQAQSVLATSQLPVWRHTLEGVRLNAQVRRSQILSSDEGAGVDWDRVRPVLDEVMRELNERDREAVLLRFFARRPFAEIGAALEVSEDAARMRVERALEKLHGRLMKRGVTSTGAALGIALANHAVGAAPTGLAGAVVGVATAAGVVGGGGMLTGIFAFMSTGKIAVGVAIVCAAVGIGSAVYQAREVARANEAVVASQRERTAAEAKAAALATQVRESVASARVAAERMAALEAQLAAAKKTAGGAPANAALAAPRASASGVSWDNPSYARAYVEKYRVGLGLRYGPLYRALGLSPEQITKFEATLTEGQQGVVDVWAEAIKQGLSLGGISASSTSVSRLTSGPLGAMENRLKELLGEAGFQHYKQFDKARGSRELITSLAGGLYSSETPLTAVQDESMAAALASNTRTERTAMTDDGKNPLYRVSEVTDWAGVQKQAQGFLSAPQLVALKALSDQKQLDQEMAKLASAAASAAAAKPAASGGK